jgi:hypothetical protein
LAPIVDDFSSQLCAVIEKFTADRVNAAGPTKRRASMTQKVRVRSSRAKLCYYSGCKNVAAPRFGMFCAAKHKDLPVSVKAKHRAARVEAGR